MSDEATRKEAVEMDPYAILEEEASGSLWSKCKWFPALVVPAGLLFGLMMVLAAPEEAAEIPTWFLLTACVVLASGVGCVFLIPYVAHLTVVRVVMVRKQPDHGWGRRAGTAAALTIVLLLWLGAILTPIVFRQDIGLANFALATLFGAGICISIAIAEMAFALFGFLVFITVGRRLAKRSGRKNLSE